MFARTQFEMVSAHASRVAICLLFTTITVQAESTNVPVAVPLTTNWITAVPWYREVNGQLYNTESSIKFENISADCRSVCSNGILLHWVKTQPIYKSYSWGSQNIGNFIGGGTERVKTGEKVEFEKNIFVLHHPLQGVAEGQKLDFRAIRIGVTNFDSSTIELWDYGTPHRVMVISTNNTQMKFVAPPSQTHLVVVGDTLQKSPKNMAQRLNQSKPQTNCLTPDFILVRF